MDDMSIQLGERIRYFREASGLSQDELANRAGIAMQYLSRLERGKTNPTVGILNQIALALAVPLPVLVDYATTRTRSQLLHDIHERIEVMPEDTLRSLLHLTITMQPIPRIFSEKNI